MTVRSYVPDFMTIKAHQIHEWADRGEEARSRLPVLVRKLIRSTGSDLRRVDFPGYGEAQRPAGTAKWKRLPRRSGSRRASRDGNSVRLKIREGKRAGTSGLDPLRRRRFRPKRRLSSCLRASGVASETGKKRARQRAAGRTYGLWTRATWSSGWRNPSRGRSGWPKNSACRRYATA